MPGLVFGFWRRPRRANATAKAATDTAPQVDFDRILAGVRAAPQLEMIEWTGDGLEDAAARTVAAAQPARPAATSAAAPADEDTFDAAALDGRRRKIRDRYIAARFPGIAKCGADLADEEAIVRAARLMFEDDRAADALELLELALEEYPARDAAWLARLEILYLTRDAAGFTEAAHAFRRHHAAHTEAWTEVSRLGRALAPHEPLFAGNVAVRDHEHYGPWPHTPNWIRAPWDLSAEVAAADFHHAVRRSAADSAAKEAA
jgi:hypothetical protein